MDVFVIPADLRAHLIEYLGGCPIRDAQRVVPMVQALERAPQAKTSEEGGAPIAVAAAAPTDAAPAAVDEALLSRGRARREAIASGPGSASRSGSAKARRR